MSNFEAPLSPSAGSPSRAPRRGVLALLAGVLAALSMLFLAQAAMAVVETDEGVTAGVQPRNDESFRWGYYEEAEVTLGKISRFHTDAKTFANPAGNPVVHASDVYLIYWDPDNLYHKEWHRLINGFVNNVGSEPGALKNIFNAMSQYRDKTNTGALDSISLKGAYTDTHQYPASGCLDPKPLVSSFLWGPAAVGCLTDAQLRAELQSYIASMGLPKGLNTIYYVLTPPGVTLCMNSGSGACSDFIVTSEEEEEDEFPSYENSFCSYHSDINPGGLPTGDANTILYGALPWTAGTYGDGYLYPNLVPGWECQDGGWDPSLGPVETREAPFEATSKEEEEFEEANPAEKETIQFEDLGRGEHQEEPNQQCPGEEGYCETGLADLEINQLAVEQQNIMTDPLLNAWQDEEGAEASDECRDYFNNALLEGDSAADLETVAGNLSNQEIGGGLYYLQDAFNLSALLENRGHICVGNDILEPEFTAPNTANAGEVLGFDGTESNVYLSRGTAYPTGSPTTTFATYKWNFGDGTPEVSGYAPGAPLHCEAPWLSPCAASVFHSYQYGGTYTVTLTITDVGGNTATVTHEVTVDGPVSPNGSGNGNTKGASYPAPSIAAAIISRSLRKALHKGLMVRYSVSEEVAGHFEVLLSSALAHKLHIGGSPATNLPAGTPPQIVIAKALLVTTTGGHRTIKIKLSKKVAGRLSHLHKASFLLRLIVRNASTQSPLTATVTSAATLSH